MATKVTSRRGFIAGLMAAGMCPVPTWAEAGDPAFLSAAKRADGSYALFGLTAFGQMVFEIPLPGRGHAAAAHPHQPYAVGFARRPGTFALVINCSTGQVGHELTAPKGRHFYGHGAFSKDGLCLFTTENDFERAEGRIGLWDVRSGYRRIGEFASGGVGPHEMRLMPDGAALVVANGGIETHPDSGRTKLNLPTMRPNLSYLSLDGELLDRVELQPELRLASIRHLAVRSDGLVGFGCQWQGELKTDVPLTFTHQRGGQANQLPNPSQTNGFQGYVGSIAISGDGRSLAASSPVGNVAVLHDLKTGIAQVHERSDICGVAPTMAGVAWTTGEGRFLRSNQTDLTETANAAVSWDNHLVAI